MIDLLLPLGLLGLLGVAALIIIHLIRPNYQTKHITSTYIWKLSLNYRKRQLPSSPLKNILLILCQVLILCSMALILAQPVWRYDFNKDEEGVIAIIDSSASMYAQTENETRFSRALQKTIDLINATAAKGGEVTVILADDTPDYLQLSGGTFARSVSPRNAARVISELQTMLEDPDSCSYGTSDIPAAVELSEEVLGESPSTKVYLYTDTQYTVPPKGIIVESVTGELEWNVGILNAYAELEENYYVLTVEMASYGNADVPVELAVQVALTGGATMNFNHTVFCESGVTKTVIFRYGGGEDTDDVSYYELTDEERFSSFLSIHVSFDEGDSFRSDNSFNVYGGNKETVRIQYVSTDPNPFFPAALNVMTSRIFVNKWNIRIREVEASEGYDTSGYDFYIFEHMVPSTLPQDGVVLLSDPPSAPVGANFSVLRTLTLGGRKCSARDASSAQQILKGIDPERILLWAAQELNYDDTVYEPLLLCDGVPVLLTCNRDETKVAVMSFSVNYSNIVRTEFFLPLLSNLFEYYFPSTVEKYVYEVGEEIEVKGRGPKVYVKETDETLQEFPAKLSFSSPRVITLEQESYFEREYPDINVYIRTPASESDIWHVEDGLKGPVVMVQTENSYDDLIIWVAAALVALLFAEWWLQSLANK